MKRLFSGLEFFAAFAVPAAIWAIALILFGIYPFGEKSILITDMGQQYIEYHAALYDAVIGCEGLIYTWKTGLGMNFVGLFAYYLASPFTLLMFILPRAAITESVLLIISAKIASAGLTFSIFLRKALKVNGLTNIMFASLYALSAYPVVYCFNIMWLDAVVLLPLVILAMIHTVNTNKIAPLTIVLAITFFSNFYTAFMVGLYSLLSLICLVWIRSYQFRRCLVIFGWFFLAAALAAGLTAFLTLPTAFALIDSQGTMASDWIFVGLMTDPLTLIGKLTYGAYDSITDYGTPFIYCGVLTLGLLPIWLLHREIPRRERTACIVFLGVLLVSMLFSLLDYIWHAAENPVWFPARYSFVFIFTLLIFAVRVVSLSHTLKPKRIIGGFTLAAVLVVSAKLPEWLFPDVCNTMTGSLWVTLLVLFVYAVLIILLSRRRRWLRSATMVLMALCIAVELTGNTLASLRNLDKEMHFEKRSTYASYFKQGNELKNALKNAVARDADIKSDDFFRVENSRARNANDGMSSGYHAVSHYSSFSRRDTFGFLKNCGMMCLSANKIFRYYGSTSALDAILGVRYVFSKYERRSGYIDTGIEVNDLKLWKNINSLPLTFFADGSILDVKTDGSPFDCLNRFLNSFDKIQRTYYTPLVVTDSIDGGEIKKTRTRNQIIAGTSSTLKFTISNPRAQHVLIYFDNNIPEFTAVYLNGERLNLQNERLVRGVIELGFLPQGEAVVSLTVSGDTRWYSGLCAASFNTEAFDQLISTLQKSAPNTLSVSKTFWGEPVVSGKFNAPRNGALFTSIPADCGWSAEIDGQKVSPIATGNAFIAIPVTRGEHVFKLHYRPKGLAAGIFISAATATLCMLMWCIKRYRKTTGRLFSSAE